jgi:hypothetical protein
MLQDCLVFGSNIAGRHGKGAALTAKEYYGAIPGCGIGIQGPGLLGTSYGIPTKGQFLNVLHLSYIHYQVQEFLAYAHEHPELNCLVTRIGCGLAGYKNEQIAPMFVGDTPNNCSFDPEWLEFGLKIWTHAPHQ